MSPPVASPVSVSNVSEVPIILKDELSSLPKGLVVICPSKPSGINFLITHNAWGFVRIRQIPEYFALYVASPQSRILFFGEVQDIVYPKDPKSPLTKEQRLQYEESRKGKKLIILKPNSLKKLKEGIPKGTRWVQGLFYVPLDQFIEARTLDDLRK